MADLVLAVRQYLADQADVTEVLGSDATFDTWLFTDHLYAEVSGSQLVAAVLTLEGGWTSPNSYNTAAFPRLGVTYYADPQRDSMRNLVADDTRAKLLAAHDVFDRHLHRPTMATAWWGGVRILSSTRLNEPAPRPWSDSDHDASMQIFYGIGIG